MMRVHYGIIGVLSLIAAGCGPKAPPEVAAPEPVLESPASSVDVLPLEQRIHRAAELLAQTPETPERARQARELLESARREAPDNPIVHLNLGIAAHRLGDLDAAEKAWQSVIGLDPAQSAAYLYLGQLARARGRVDSAVANFRNGIRNAPEDMDLRVGLVATLREADRLDEALREAKEALSVNADNVQLFNHMGLAYLDQGEYVLAKFVFQKARSIPGGEDDPLLNANLGWTYYLEGDPDLALYRLEEARKLDPELVPTLVYLAHLYMDDHNWEDALQALESAARQEPENPVLQLNLGICYRGVGRHEDARKAYEKALQLDPLDPAPLFNLGVLLGDSLKNYDAAIASFQQYIDRGGEQAELASQYMGDVEREKRRVERKRKADEERRKREQERLERQRLLEEAEKAGASSAPSPDEPAQSEPSAPQEPDGSPWGGQQE